MTPPLLRLAIAGQYAAFNAPPPSVMDGCECCTTPGQLCALTSRPREALTAAALDFYARKAVTTVGSISDLRYFWPRLAELAVAGALTTDVEVVMGKPLYAAHVRWPKEERAALLSFADALGARLAAETLEEGETDTWVCAIGLLSETLGSPKPFLEPLLAHTDAAWQNLRDFIRSNEPTLQKKGRLTNAFWDEAPQGAKETLAWVTTHPRVMEARQDLAAESTRLYGTVPPTF